MHPVPPLYLRVDATGSSGADRIETTEIKRFMRQRYPEVFNAVREIGDGATSDGFTNKVLASAFV